MVDKNRIKRKKERKKDISQVSHHHHHHHVLKSPPLLSGSPLTIGMPTIAEANTVLQGTLVRFRQINSVPEYARDVMILNVALNSTPDRILDIEVLCYNIEENIKGINFWPESVLLQMYQDASLSTYDKWRTYSRNYEFMMIGS